MYISTAGRRTTGAFQRASGHQMLVGLRTSYLPVFEEKTCCGLGLAIRSGFPKKPTLTYVLNICSCKTFGLSQKVKKTKDFKHFSQLRNLIPLNTLVFLDLLGKPEGFASYVVEYIHKFCFLGKQISNENLTCRKYAKCTYLGEEVYT